MCSLYSFKSDAHYVALRGQATYVVVRLSTLSVLDFKNLVGQLAFLLFFFLYLSVLSLDTYGILALCILQLVICILCYLHVTVNGLNK